MTEITNDRELKVVLDRLDAAAQRRLAAQFTSQVRDLIHDPGLSQALETALDPDADDSMREAAWRNARAIATASYTACGQDVDWNGQAEHFAAAACALALSPARETEGSIAWKAAIHARMADNCRQLAGGGSGQSDLIREQYRLAAGFSG